MALPQRRRRAEAIYATGNNETNMLDRVGCYECIQNIFIIRFSIALNLLMNVTLLTSFDESESQKERGDGE